MIIGLQGVVVPEELVELLVMLLKGCFGVVRLLVVEIQLTIRVVVFEI